MNSFWIKLISYFIKRNRFNFHSNLASNQDNLNSFSFLAKPFISFFRYSFRILSFSCEYALTHSLNSSISFSLFSSLNVLYVSKFIPHNIFAYDASFLFFSSFKTLLLFLFYLSGFVVNVEGLFVLRRSDKLNEVLFIFSLPCFSNFHRNCLFSFDSKYSLFSKSSFYIFNILFFYTISP